MRGDLLSIGEVSHLKGVGVKALRYYERIGVLRPAYVNPETGYRYYAMRQMNELDVVVFCVQLGVPLKELADYLSGDGVMNTAALLDHARELAQERLRSTRALIMELEGCRSEIAAQEHCRAQRPLYERNLGGRLFFGVPWRTAGFDVKRYAKTMTELYGKVKSCGLVPLFLQGMARFSSADPQGPKSEGGGRGSGSDTTADGRGGSSALAGGGGCPDALAGGGGGRWFAVLEAAPLPGEEERIASACVNEVRAITLPDRTYCGQRVERDALDRCFREAFRLADGHTADGIVLAMEVWDAELRSDNAVIEVLRG